MLEFNNLKRIADKLEPDRDSDKKRLIEITERKFEVNIFIFENVQSKLIFEMFFALQKLKIYSKFNLFD